MTSLKNNFRHLLSKFRKKSLYSKPSDLEGKYDQPLQVVYRKGSIHWNQKLLCITHSERPIAREYANLNYLEKRFSNPNRLPPSEPFESLWPSYNFAVYLGQITIWGFRNGNFTQPHLLAHLRPTPNGYKPQHAIWYKNRLWVLGFDGLDVYNSDLDRIIVIRDPWLTGGHTIFPDNQGHLLISCSGSDSVLVIDEEDYKIINSFRVPESIYGHNYKLRRDDSTIDHYIDNDSQLTHINCAWPWKNGILVSNFIQGAIGWFDHSGNYQELVRGFVGCHGVRTDSRTDQIYFSDSCIGTVNFLTPNCTLDYRVDADSRWLHDAHQLKDNIFALAVADHNRIDIMDFCSRQVVATIPGNKFGNTTQFIYYGQ